MLSAFDDRRLMPDTGVSRSVADSIISYVDRRHGFSGSPKIDAGGWNMLPSAQSVSNRRRQPAAKLGRGLIVPASQAIGLAFPGGRN
jgi:hypothetical protein